MASQTQSGGSCNGCSLSLDYTYYAGDDDFANGPVAHAFSISATDYAGNTSSQQIQITVDPPSGAVKYSANDDASTDSLPGYDDGTDTCRADPDPAPDGQYCGATDDPNNANTQAAAGEPAVGQNRPTIAQLPSPATAYLTQLSTSDQLRVAQGLTPNSSGWGISDDNTLAATTFQRSGQPTQTAMFDDPLFQNTHVMSVRRIVPWDLIARVPPGTADTAGNVVATPNVPGVSQLSGGVPTGNLSLQCGPNGSSKTIAADPTTFQQQDAWLTAAHTHYKEVLVSFQHTSLRNTTDNGVAESCFRPSERQYRAATRAFLAEYPWVKLYTAWNEPNHAQPTSRAYDNRYKTSFNGEPAGAYSGAQLAGLYYRDLEQSCKQENPKCTVGAGDFLDDKTFQHSVKTTKYFTAYKNGAGSSRPPTVWAWHAYEEGYAHNNQRLKQFLQATAAKSGSGHSNPRVWLTEQGGEFHLYRFHNESRTQAAADADSALRYMLSTLPGVDSTRITRMYVYQWIGGQEVCVRNGQPDYSALVLSSNNPGGLPSCGAGGLGANPFDSGLLDANAGGGPPRQMYTDFTNWVTAGHF